MRYNAVERAPIHEVHFVPFFLAGRLDELAPDLLPFLVSFFLISPSPSASRKVAMALPLWNETASVSPQRCLRTHGMRRPRTRSRNGKSPSAIYSSITVFLQPISRGFWTKTTNTLSASSSVHERRRSSRESAQPEQRARYSGGARSDHGNLGKICGVFSQAGSDLALARGVR